MCTEAYCNVGFLNARVGQLVIRCESTVCLRFRIVNGILCLVPNRANVFVSGDTSGASASARGNGMRLLALVPRRLELFPCSFTFHHNCELRFTIVHVDTEPVCFADFVHDLQHFTCFCTLEQPGCLLRGKNKRHQQT